MKIHPNHNPRGFTLIELLVVITIIGILATISFPITSAVIGNARKRQAQNDAAQLANAITAYQAEYGKYPSVGNGSNIPSDSSLMLTLLGDDSTTNPRGIAFFEGKISKDNARNGLTSANDYMDPWGSAYILSWDADYDNKVDSPTIDTDSPDELRKGVIAWSIGDPEKPVPVYSYK